MLTLIIALSSFATPAPLPTRSPTYTSFDLSGRYLHVQDEQESACGVWHFDVNGRFGGAGGRIGGWHKVKKNLWYIEILRVYEIPADEVRNESVLLKYDPITQTFSGRFETGSLTRHNLSFKLYPKD